MPRHRITAAIPISAPAGYVYAMAGDYRPGRPRMLPERHYRELRVERGGVGPGTVISFTTRVLGWRRPVRVLVSEPEGGRVLLERDLVSGALTTVTVDRRATGDCTVTLATDFTVRTGLRGALERAVKGVVVRRRHREQLARLAAAARNPAGADGWSLPVRRPCRAPAGQGEGVLQPM